MALPKWRWNAALWQHPNLRPEINALTKPPSAKLASNRSVIVHSTKSGSDKRIAAKLKGRTAEVLGGSARPGAARRGGAKFRASHLHRGRRYVELRGASDGD
jgi:hypothetical protein